jgi:putative ABC transport system ATP-binding protein
VTPPNTPLLSVTGAKKTFNAGTSDSYTALAGLNLELALGDFVTVIGSNGAGKSTLFNAIAGNIVLDEGRIVLDGEDITFQKEHRRAKHIGRLFQDPHTGTAPALTIEENLALVYSKATNRFPLALALRAKERAAFRETLSRLGMGLENRLKTKVEALSGGQRQALTLLIATLVPPKLLLLDEHTAALDPVTAKKVLDLTADIAGSNAITTLMITHNVSSALELGTRTVMMHKGGIVMDIRGKERAAMTMEALLARYKDTVHERLNTDTILLSEVYPSSTISLSSVNR